MRMIQTLLYALYASAIPASADVTPNAVFQHNAVLQQGQAVPVWGKADPGERVMVRFKGREVAVTADAQGRWKAELPPMTVDAQGHQLVIEGKNDVVIENVLVGEVWYASGQSNMWYPLRAIASKWDVARKALAEAEYPGIRFYRISSQKKREVTWEITTPSVAEEFPATAFFFARKLHRELRVPIAIIDGSSPAKPIEPFIPTEILRELPELERLLEGWQGPGDLEVGSLHDQYAEPVVSYGIRGFIWYQGESNATNPRSYRLKMEGLIKGWRKKWGNQQLPFYWVQLSDIAPIRNGWPYLRDEQRLALAIPGTGMAVIADIDGNGIHPSNKVDVGKRLALWALVKQYGMDIAYSGPLFKEAKIEGSSVRIAFDHAEGGLMTGEKDGHLPVRETVGDAVRMVQVAGEDGQWHDADEVAIEGTSLIASCSEVAEPIAVRYAYHPAHNESNLYNKAGLPATPFISRADLRDPDELFVHPTSDELYRARKNFNKAMSAASLRHKENEEYSILLSASEEANERRQAFFAERLPDIAARPPHARRGLIKRAERELSGEDFKQNQLLVQGIAEAEAAAQAWLMDNDEECRKARMQLENASEANAATVSAPRKR